MARPQYIEAMLGKLRAVDQLEASMIFGCTADQGLVESYRNSLKCWVALLDGTPIAAFGVVPDGSTGIPWMVGTPELDKVPLTFVRQSKERVEELFGGFARLENYIWAGNVRSIGWLEYCGFKLDAPINGIMRFWRERDSQNS